LYIFISSLVSAGGSVCLWQISSCISYSYKWRV
jgi:hypothetical protein